MVYLICYSNCKLRWVSGSLIFDLDSYGICGCLPAYVQHMGMGHKVTSNYIWLEVWNMTFIFPYIWNVIIDELIFFRRGFVKHQPDILLGWTHPEIQTILAKAASCCRQEPDSLTATATTMPPMATFWDERGALRLQMVMRFEGVLDQTWKIWIKVKGKTT